MHYKHIPLFPKYDRLRLNLHPFFATTCFLFPNPSIILIFHVLEIFCRVFNFRTIKLEYAKLLVRSIFRIACLGKFCINSCFFDHRYISCDVCARDLSLSCVPAKLMESSTIGSTACGRIPPVKKFCPHSNTTRHICLNVFITLPTI